MQAFVIDSFGAPDVFRTAELPNPEPGSGQVLIRVAATSVNPVDYKVRSGAVAALAPPSPSILHGDVSGTVAKVGEGVTGFAEGDEVYGCIGGVGKVQGVLADFAVADARFVAKRPRTISLSDSAALPLVAITAWEGLDKAAVGEGQRVLVHGGTGGVGHVALQLAKARGAEVTVTCSSAEKSSLAVELGADHVADYREETVEQYVERLTEGRGFDVVFDTVGGENLQRAMAAACLNGAVVNIQARGEHDLGLAHLRGLSIHVVFMLIPLLHGVGRERHGRILAEVADLVDAGQLRPLIDARRFTFDTIGGAHAYAESGKATGKVLAQRNRHGS